VISTTRTTAILKGVAITTVRVMGAMLCARLKRMAMMMSERSRMVKLYFRDQDKIMRSIPNLVALVRNDELRKVYTLKENSRLFPGQSQRSCIYILSDD